MSLSMSAQKIFRQQVETATVACRQGGPIEQYRDQYCLLFGPDTLLEHSKTLEGIKELQRKHSCLITTIYLPPSHKIPSEC